MPTTSLLYELECSTRMCLQLLANSLSVAILCAWYIFVEHYISIVVMCNYLQPAAETVNGAPPEEPARRQGRMTNQLAVIHVDFIYLHNRNIMSFSIFLIFSLSCKLWFTFKILLWIEVLLQSSDCYHTRKLFWTLTINYSAQFKADWDIRVVTLGFLLD